MSMIVSRDIYDGMHIKKVSVIASYDTKGQISPLYIRIGEESFKVVTSAIKTHTKIVIVFKCQVARDNVAVPVDLTLHREDNIWTIPENIYDSE